MIFVTAASLLVSLVAVLIVNLSGSIDTLMIKSKTPHFMQMHSGEIDMSRLEAFTKGNIDVEDFQVINFLNVDGSNISLGSNSLTNSVQDNGLTTQSDAFDYLLDLDGEVIQVLDGEIYVPICYKKDGTAKIGDKAIISGKEFTIAGFLRDSQMNSLLSSSKRFLISNHDYENIKEQGKVEYLIEFRLKSTSAITNFQRDYTASGLEANGPTLTYPLFKTLNAISDGIMISIILLVSVLVVAIALICIRFTLLAKIEDDYREIGVMKAIGLHVSDIKKIYLAKYATIAAIGSIIGFLLSFVFRGFLLENIRLYMGESGNPSASLLLAILGVFIVFLAIIAYVNRVLRRFKKISAVEAIRFGISNEKSMGGKHFTLSKNSIFNTNVFLGIKDVLARKRLYITMLLVLILAAFIIIVPQNLYHTISEKGFVKFMGIGECDIRLDIQQTEHIEEKTKDITKAMDKDRAISKYVVLTMKSFHMKTEEGTEEPIKVELGDHSVFPVSYSKGSAPTLENEIALSVMNANELNKKVGDHITLMIGEKEKKLLVCGIYSDITNGGKTAKAIFLDDSTDVMWSVLCAKFSDSSVTNKKILEYSNQFDYAKVSGIYEYMMQTFGSTINSINKAANVAIVISLILSVLVTLLFLKMLVVKDRYSIAVMKSFGFTNSDINIQYVARTVFVLSIGIVLGTILANTLGEVLAGVLISSFGAASFQFTVNPLSSYVLCPLMMICGVLIATLIGTSNAGKVKISDNIKE
jgi:putative ABC transport system permease protein